MVAIVPAATATVTASAGQPWANREAARTLTLARARARSAAGADAVVAATTRYGMDFCCAIWRDNVVATQFHPEKSQDKGLAMLRNFATMN